MKFDIPVPTKESLNFDIFLQNRLNSMRCSTMPEYKRDCYWFYEDHDMGATIPCCSLETQYASTPCEGCKRYLSRDEIREIALKISRERETKGED